MYGREKFLHRRVPHDPISAIATIGTAFSGGMAAAGGLTAVLGAVGTIGTWVSVLGMATGNERLAKFGSVMGLVGSVGGWLASASSAANPTLAKELANKSMSEGAKNAVGGAATQGPGMLSAATAPATNAAVQGMQQTAQQAATRGVEIFPLGVEPSLATAPASSLAGSASPAQTGLINQASTDMLKNMSNASRPLDAVNMADRMGQVGAAVPNAGAAPGATVPPAASGSSGFSLKGLTDSLQPWSDFFKENKEMFSAIGGIAKYMQPSDNMRVFETWQRNANDIPVYRSQFNPAPAR